MNPQALELNETIRQNPAIYNLLSKKGREIFFPAKGIIQQSLDAKGKRYNATAGAAYEDDGKTMCLSGMEKLLNLDPDEVFTYSSSFGEKKLREKWLELIKKKNPSLKSKTSLPIVTCALTHALTVAGYLFVNEGDNIILPDLYWGNYRLIFEHQFNAKLNTFNFFKEGFDMGSFEQKLECKGKKIILLNFPNNPTGYTPTENEADEIVGLIKRSAENGSEIVVLCDDAYFGLVYKEGIMEESIFARLSNLHENILAIKIDGITKEEYAWGLRVGFITFACKGISDDVCKSLENKATGAVRGSISNASHLSQTLALKGFESDSYDADKQKNFELLMERFKEVEKVLEDEKYKKYFTVMPFNSGYFMCIKLNVNAENIRQILLKKYDTGIIAMGSLIRIAFSSVPVKNIKQLFENIYNACEGSK